MSVGITQNGKFDKINWIKIEPIQFSKKFDIKFCVTGIKFILEAASCKPALQKKVHQL